MHCYEIWNFISIFIFKTIERIRLEMYCKYLNTWTHIDIVSWSPSVMHMETLWCILFFDSVITALHQMRPDLWEAGML